MWSTSVTLKCAGKAVFSPFIWKIHQSFEPFEVTHSTPKMVWLDTTQFWIRGQELASASSLQRFSFTRGISCNAWDEFFQPLSHPTQELLTLLGFVTIKVLLFKSPKKEKKTKTNQEAPKIVFGGRELWKISLKCCPKKTKTKRTNKNEQNVRLGKARGQEMKYSKRV